MQISTLEQKLLPELKKKSKDKDIDLDVDSLTLSYVLNSGGFTNASFKLSDCRKTYHLKIAQNDDNKKKLQQWYKIHTFLESSYHAPKILAELSFPELNLFALLFENIEGKIPQFLDNSLKAEIISSLQKLHQDKELFSIFCTLNNLSNAEYSSISYAQIYKNTYHDRFSEDLKIIKTNPPNFVSQELLIWMEQESLDLLNYIENASEFALNSNSLAHGDLWLNNILICNNKNTFYILDWDDLSISDPAIDIAMFLGPSEHELRPYKYNRAIETDKAYSIDNNLRNRLELYSRASILDWIIDPLADYIESSVLGKEASKIQDEKRKIHLQALNAYKECWFARV